MQKLLKEGDYTMEAKRKNRKMGAFSVVYWLILTAIYLAWSFSTNTWDKTWIVYVVGGVIYAALCVVLSLIHIFVFEQEYFLEQRMVKDAEEIACTKAAIAAAEAGFDKLLPRLKTGMTCLLYTS